MQLILNKDDAAYYFQKGYRHHQSREYREAWESWIVAHGLQNGNYHVTAANQILRAIMSLPADAHDLPDQGKDLIFIVGMPRTGTTLLEQVLATKSNVTGHGERREFVAILDDALIKRDFNLDLNAIRLFQAFYRESIKNIATRYHVDKMPRNALAIPLIKTVFPQCKIIQTSRDRFSTCMSIYSSNFADFTPYAHRWETLNLFFDHCRLIGQKYKHLTYEISFEDIVSNFEPTIRQLFDYLQLQYTGEEVHFYKNKTDVRTCSKEQVKQPLNTNGLTQWLPYKPIVYGDTDDRL